MAERCRLCLIDHGCMTSLQDERLETQLKDLTKCTCIDIKYEETLPGVVCHVCLYKLDMWSEFKERFIQSNKVLLEQLEISDVSDSTIKDSSKDKSCTTKNVKNKRKGNEDGVLEKKKARLDVASPEGPNITCDTDHALDTIYISSDDNDSAKAKDGKSGEEHAEGKKYSGPIRPRLLPARRGRNIERRRAFTKRWVERKKALLAATGDVSDTDSIASDDVQLSPVQKARAKTKNADKELERQRKVAKVLKSLETNLTEKYKVPFRDKDTDSEARRTRLSASQQNNKNSLLNQRNKANVVERNFSSLDSSMEIENSALTDNVMLDDSIKSETQSNEKFVPQSLKSQVMIGDTTYAVTSTLILVDPSNKQDFNKDLNNLTTDSKSLSPDESNREKNTDIIDAVQLRRIKPVVTKANSKSNSKLTERFLNIEVEGNELSVLRHVQQELAKFVEKDMKQKLLSSCNDVRANKSNKMTDNATVQDKLDQKLKDIIEVAIKKNVEFSVKLANARGPSSTRLSPTLTKSAMNSPRYQPKVMLKRLDITKESKHYNINNVHALLKSTGGKLARPFNVVTKRKSVPPIRYCDYNTILDSDSDVSDAIIQETPKAINSKISRNTARKQLTIASKPAEQKQGVQKTEAHQAANKAPGVKSENHICGVCGITFYNRDDAEAHVRGHKASGASVVQVVLENSPQKTATSPQKTAATSQKIASAQKGKQKMMRCKRCHEIVEARLVKTHVCKTSLHKCYVCDSMFRTKSLLSKHLESHDHTEFNVANAIGNKKLNNADALLKILSVASASPKKEQEQETETATKTPTAATEKNDIQSDKITSTGVKLDGAENIARKPKETYTCFVCDKIFTDEEILKDHLQQHCDDLSEGEQNSSKEQYQCAICGSTLESDQALEEHVGKHLYDDEDDNPNLISIDQGKENDNDKSISRESETYQCGQCSETFDSEMLLEMHMHAHEEEFAIAEWEKEGMRVYHYQCMLCDELFNTEEELAEHLDVHNANAQVCQLCDKPFRTLEDLQEHVATH